MKPVVASMFVFLFMTQVFNQWVILLEFNINRAYIARHLCENRYRPQLHCNGRCVLMKRMAEEQNQKFPSLKLNWDNASYTGHATAKTYTLQSKRPGFSIPLKLGYACRSFVPAVFRPPLS